jgi:hypothetical protein
MHAMERLRALARLDLPAGLVLLIGRLSEEELDALEALAACWPTERGAGAAGGCEAVPGGSVMTAASDHAQRHEAERKAKAEQKQRARRERRRAKRSQSYLERDNPAQAVAAWRELETGCDAARWREVMARIEQRRQVADKAARREVEREVTVEREAAERLEAGKRAVAEARAAALASTPRRGELA